MTTEERKVGSVYLSWQSTPAQWMAYEDPESSTYGMGKTPEEAIVDYFEQAREDDATAAARDEERALAWGEKVADAARELLTAGLDRASLAHVDKIRAAIAECPVWYLQREGATWRRWSTSATPKPPQPRDAPFWPTAQEGVVQWPATGVHFVAIKFGTRVWSVKNGWVPRLVEF